MIKLDGARGDEPLNDTILEYKCPCCGGAISFDSTAQKMKCPYCDSEFDVDTLEAYANGIRTESGDDMSWDGARDEQCFDELCGYTCSSCGGELMTDENTAASSCPFCGNPVILKGRLSGALRPDLVIPFKLDRKAACEALTNHYKGKLLLPKVFKERNHIESVKGIYVPFWLFDADADADVRYRATRLRIWSDSRYDYTETSHFAVFRRGEIGFEGVPVDGSSKMEDDLMESIEPFDLSDAVDFNSAYLAGYLADKYDVDSASSEKRANERIKRSTEDAFRSTVIGYDTVIAEHSGIRLKNTRARYALYPVWLLNTTWNGKTFTFAMNGQTGRFAGNLPVDIGSAVKWAIGITLGVGALVYAAAWILKIAGII